VQAHAVDRQLRRDNDVAFARLMEVGYTAFAEPLLPHLEGVETLFIAPDGPLHALPFEALVDGDGRRLVERFQGSVQDTCKMWSQGGIEGQRLRVEGPGEVVHIERILTEAANVLAHVGT